MNTERLQGAGAGCCMLQVSAVCRLHHPGHLRLSAGKIIIFDPLNHPSAYRLAGKKCLYVRISEDGVLVEAEGVTI